jgi:uncharacterized protein (DUF58 family)
MASVTKPGHLDLLDPVTLSRMGNLDLIARQVVEGMLSGRHRAPYKGFSVEFAEHREYSPGDETRSIDWRVFAKRDRYYVKEYEQETNLRAYLLVDASGSMRFAGEAAGDVSKFRYAQMLAACLAYLLLGQQDEAGLLTFDTQTRSYIPPRSRAIHLRAMLGELQATEPGGETALAPVLHDIAERITHRGLVILISDCFDDPESLRHALHHFRHRRHEVILLHVTAQEERTFPYRQRTRFRDLERLDRQLVLDPRGLREAYLERMNAFCLSLESACNELVIDYVPVDTSRPFADTLLWYLSWRQAKLRW